MFKKSCETLAQRKLTISFLESASAGYLAYQFSLSPFSGDILVGSLVCYDLKVKKNLLHISASLIKKYTAESMEVTEQMIYKGKSLFKSDFYVACTGLLKKGGSESKGKPVGTFFYVIAYQNKIYRFREVYHGKPDKKLSQLKKSICKNIIHILKQQG